jgi:hypothetical protein
MRCPADIFWARCTAAVPDYAQHALAPDAAPLRFAAQVKRRPLGRRVGGQAAGMLKSARDGVAQAQRDRSVMRRWSAA